MISSLSNKGHMAKLAVFSVSIFVLLSVTGLALPVLAVGPDSVEKVTVFKDSNGQKLQVDGRDFMVFGMNWGYMPIGENYSYDLWGKSDDFIKSMLADEMPLLQAMGVNTIRQYAGIPPRWVKYIYETYDIYTIVNHPVARWGYTLDGLWNPNTDYSNPKLRAAVKEEIFNLVKEFEGVPGVLMWLLGNENNYGIWWSSFEIEALPKGDQNSTRARFLYSLMGEIIDGIHELDSDRPVSMANGDVQYIDIIAEECSGLDIFGTNQYRGISVRDMNDVVKEKMDIPLMYTEFGSDAFNAKEMVEDQSMQAKYLIGQWKEIYDRSYGKGLVGNAIGGIIFQWSDGWWKFRQEERLDVHDTNASWPNGAYPDDLVDGENNMNEEWWGICAKGRSNNHGLYEVYPRAAYYALTKAFKLDPYAPDTDLTKIASHFATVTPGKAVLEAKGDRAALLSSAQSKVRISGMRMEYETYSTGGAVVNTPETPAPNGGYPSFMGFDNMQSFYVDIESKPSANVIANLSLNVLGNVPENPIDEIFYENRGRKREITANGEDFSYEGFDRVKAYQGSFSWDDKWFEMQGFYRTGHIHWGFEGDFFGLYRDAFYGENIDIYNGMAPVGVEVSAKKSLKGLKMAFGPQLWWGANPSVLMKYQRNIGKYALTGIVQEDIAPQSALNTSIAVPLPETRKVSLQAVTNYKDLIIEGGTIWSGSKMVGEEFQIYDDVTTEEVRILQDTIKDGDAWGFKGKVTMEKNAYRWYAQSAYMGLVAEGGPTEVITFTGWKLKDSGSGNQKNFITGFTYNKGDWQIGPNFLWQKPIIGPVPGDSPDPGSPRNRLSDPFAVGSNREMTGAEILLTYDPHPETWFYAWDNNRREGAHLAFNLGFVYKDMPTTRDAGLFVDSDGSTVYAFPGASPGHSEWEIHSRVAGQLDSETRLVANAYAGMAEPNGWVYLGNDIEDLSIEDRQLNDQVNRIIHRYGVDARLIHKSLSLYGVLKIGDWGIYDYHKDWNLTYPLQLLGDVSWSLGKPKWFADEPETKIGIRGLYRTLDRNSNRYRFPDDWENYGTWDDFMNEVDAYGNGSEWEVRTYISIAM
ncbi:MAG: glycosidase [bacterium]|nr:glycosidase [bacterium]MCP4799121.1 glycosidase [bacterium]